MAVGLSIVVDALATIGVVLAFCCVVFTSVYLGLSVAYRIYRGEWIR